MVFGRSPVGLRMVMRDNIKKKEEAKR